MTRFRPCIDLYQGRVSQIVGSTLDTTTDVKMNHVSAKSPSHFAALYKEHGLRGGHVIMLGPGNEDAAREACQAWPGGLQVGGGLTASNVSRWIEAGAEKVIITSYLFPALKFSLDRLKEIVGALGGDTRKLVIDLSCKRTQTDQGISWYVAANRWRDITDMEISEKSLIALAPYCSEFLVHAADVEGKQQGIDGELVSRLAEWSPIPVTYAGGARDISDLAKVEALSHGKVDLTIGSALDIFGGNSVKLKDCVDWNRNAVSKEERK